MAQCAILNLVWRQKEFVYFVLFEMQKDGFIIHAQLLASKLIEGIYEYDNNAMNTIESIGKMSQISFNS